MDQKYLTDSESLSLNMEATCLLPSSPRNFPYETKMDKYRPYPSMISMFSSDSQHPPSSRHAVHLGVEGLNRFHGAKDKKLKKSFMLQRMLQTPGSTVPTITDKRNVFKLN